jgi:nucleotide-binding universal stress UspA family protein
MKILLAVDDSPHAQAALERVRQVAWPAGTELLVLSVARPASATYAEFYAPGAPVVEQVWSERVRFHDEIATRAAESLRTAGLAAEPRVLHGDPREVIVDCARAEGVGLVVMGSHGRTGLARLLLGSVAAYVVSHAPCDVLVVRLPHAPA